MYLTRVPRYLNSFSDPESEFITCNIFWSVVLLILYNMLALEGAVRASDIEQRSTVYHKSAQILAYDNDTGIIGRSERAFKEAFADLARTHERWDRG
jgi:hypothetical protein